MVTDNELKHSRILIVDDEPSNNELLLKAFQASGYGAVWSTDSPYEAIELYREIRPDLVLLDLRMPGMDGLQVLEEFWKLEKNSYPPVIVLTGETSQQWRLKALKAGAKDFLSKPLDLTEVLYRSRNLLEIRHLYNQLLRQNQEMEKKVYERTAELKAANDHLQLEVKERIKAQGRLQKQNLLLENISEGLSLEQFLNMSRSGFREIKNLGMLVMLFDEETQILRYGASLGLPAAYRDTLHQLSTGVTNNPFVHSVMTGQTVIQDSLRRTASSALYDEAASEHGLKSVWCTPIYGKQSRVVGAFALFPDQARAPRMDELEGFYSLAHLIGILLGRIEAEDRIRMMYQQLLHSERLSAVGRLAASISHEFNNPVMGIRNVLDQIGREQVLDKELQKLTLLARDECERVMTLASRLRNFYRPSEGKAEWVDLRKIVDDMLLLNRREFDFKNVTVVKQFEENLPSVRVLPDQIKQVVINLLQNALDAIQNDGGRITLSLKSEKETVSLTVQDNGVGIDPATMKDIFDPFVSTKSAVRGTGLGLSVSYGIVKAHGGAITCDSVPGEGARFTVSLPVKGPDPQPREFSENPLSSRQ